MNSRMWGWVYTVCVSLWLLPACGEDAAPKISEVSVQVEACLGAAAREDSCRDHLDQTVQAQPGVACLVVAAEDAPQRLWRVAFEWRAQGESSALTPLGEGQIPLTGDTPIEAALYFLAGADESACDALDLAQPCASLRSCALKLSQGGRPLSAGLNFKDPDDPSRCVVEAGEALQAAGDLVEICGDGLDNNCDGRIDEDCAGDCEEGVTRGCTAEAQLGECREGTQTCSGGAWGACEPGEPKGEICGDGLDNNCDGQIDEGCDCIDGESRECGSNVGSCEMGTQICIGTTWGPCEESLGPQEEVCDGLDNDCDGVTDNVPGGCACAVGDRQQCGSDVGICEKGWQDCGDDGLWGACVGGQGPMPEVCDGLDNNCNETIDDGLSDCCAPDDERACNEGVPDIPESVCEVGMQTCLVVGENNFGFWSECVHSVTNEPVRVPGQFEEVCDGLDNDCNGEIDDIDPENYSADHCGGCGQVCWHPHPDITETQGRECDPVNYKCVFKDAQNRTPRAPIYVDCSLSGEGADGSAERPFGSIYAALQRIRTEPGQPKYDLYLAQGTCDVTKDVPFASGSSERTIFMNSGLLMIESVSVYGGYVNSGARWSRGDVSTPEARTTLSGAPVVVRYSKFDEMVEAWKRDNPAPAEGALSAYRATLLSNLPEFTKETILDGVSVKAAAQTYDRHPSVGVVAIGVGQVLRLRNVDVTTGAGKPGRPAIAGEAGQTARPWMAGQNATEENTGMSGTSGAAHGPGEVGCQYEQNSALNIWTLAGGNGGMGGTASAGAEGNHGQGGIDPQTGARTGGINRPSGSETLGAGGQKGTESQNSHQGGRGRLGYAGEDGKAHISIYSPPGNPQLAVAGKINTRDDSAYTLLWLPENSLAGERGEPGGGGGGGGGGRRGRSSESESRGGGGGGGGSGGCPGLGAGPALGGGSAFALYVMRGEVILQNVQLMAGEGGRGGQGAVGGIGGEGGAGGQGTRRDQSGGGEQRSGKNGGKGGQGGCGGASAGAVGGSSFAVMLVIPKRAGTEQDALTGYVVEGSQRPELSAAAAGPGGEGGRPDPEGITAGCFGGAPDAPAGFSAEVGCCRPSGSIDGPCELQTQGCLQP